MCTVTWRIDEDGYELVFSRDEALARPAALAPRVWSAGGTDVVSPADPQGGGTWIATNNRGVSLCLLNDYESRATRPDGRSTSRGRLVSSVAHARDSREALSLLEAADLQRFEPFQLVIFEPGAGPSRLVWSGERLRHDLGIAPPVTSSSYRPRWVARHRQRAFAEFSRRRGGVLTGDDLLAFHRGRSLTWPAASVAMRRPGRETRSLTRVRVGPTDICMDYHDGFPHRRPSPPTHRSSLARETTARVGPSSAPSLPMATPIFDLRALLARKNPGLLSRIPPKTLPLLSWLVAEGPIERGLETLRSVPPRSFAEASLRYLGVEARVFAPALPAAEAAPIYVANHPLGGLDGLVMMAFLLRRHGGLIAPVNDVLCRIPQLAGYCVPLDRENDRRSMVGALGRVFDSKAPVLLFPAGRTSRYVKGRLQDHRWGKMFVKMARRHDRSVVPVHIAGNNSNLFYGVAALRRLVGVDANVEIMLLARELLRPRRGAITVHAHETVSPQALDALGATDDERAEHLRLLCQRPPGRDAERTPGSSASAGAALRRRYMMVSPGADQ